MTVAIGELLKQVSLQLTAVTECPRLEAEVLIASALQCSKTFLYASPEYLLTPPEQEALKKLVAQRCQGIPMAYLLGYREFWSLPFKVNQHVLIPRPETELMVDTVLTLLPHHHVLRVVDLGTGSGVIALSLAYHREHWQVTATDYSPEALAVAQQNAKSSRGGERVRFLQGDWCHALPDEKFDVIISNPPYIAENDPHLWQNGLQYEPRLALVAGQQGYAALFAIIEQAKHYLTNQGWLFLEHGFAQGAAVRDYFKQHCYQQIVTHQDLNGLERITAGRLLRKPVQI